MIKEINNELKDFNKLYKRNFGFLKKMCVYCVGFTNEDIHEIALYCYFVKDIQTLIDKNMLTQKEIDNVFKYAFRKEVARDNSYTYNIKTNDDLHRVIDRFNSIASQEIDETDIENYIIDKIMYEKLLTVMSKNDLDFCIMYITRGCRYVSKIYDITEPTCRKRYQRAVDKAKKRVNKMSH